MPRADGSPPSKSESAGRSRRTSGLLGRGLLLALAALCAAVGGLALRSDDRCTATVNRARAQARPGAASAGPDLPRDAITLCAAAPPAVEIAADLAVAGHRAEATSIARALARREPQDYLGWLTLGRLEPDPVLARAALERAHALNPRVVRRPS